MNETQNGINGTSVVDRAETLLGTLGTRLNAARTKAAESVATATDPMLNSKARAKDAPGPSPAVERAEETMDQLGERLGVFAATVSHQLRKATALAREEAEDIWAEAKSLAGKNSA